MSNKEGSRSEEFAMAPQRFKKIEALVVTDVAIQECATDFSDTDYFSTINAAITDATARRRAKIAPNEFQLSQAEGKIKDSLPKGSLGSEHYAVAIKTLQQFGNKEKSLVDIDLGEIRAALVRKRDDAAHKERTGAYPTEQERRKVRRKRRRLRGGVFVADLLAAASVISAVGGTGVAIYENNQMNDAPSYAVGDKRKEAIDHVQEAIDDLHFTPAGYRTLETQDGERIRAFRPATLPQNGKAWEEVGVAQTIVKGAGPTVEDPLATVQEDLVYPVFQGDSFDDLFAKDRQLLEQEKEKIRALAQTPAAKEYQLESTRMWGAIEAAGAGLFSGVIFINMDRRLRRRRRNLPNI